MGCNPRTRAIAATVAPAGRKSPPQHHRRRHCRRATDRNSSPHRVCPPALPRRIPARARRPPSPSRSTSARGSNRSRRRSPPRTLRTASTGSMRPARGIATAPPPPPAAQARPREGRKSPHPPRPEDLVPARSPSRTCPPTRPERRPRGTDRAPPTIPSSGRPPPRNVTQRSSRPRSPSRPPSPCMNRPISESPPSPFPPRARPDLHRRLLCDHNRAAAFAAADVGGWHRHAPPAIERAAGVPHAIHVPQLVYLLHPRGHVSVVAVAVRAGVDYVGSALLHEDP